MDIPRLTPREMDAFRFSCRGLTNAQIGDRMFITPNTVKNMLRFVYRKFRDHGCSSAPHGNRATWYCYLLGLADAALVFRDHTEEWG